MRAVSPKDNLDRFEQDDRDRALAEKEQQAEQPSERHHGESVRQSGKDKVRPGSRFETEGDGTF